MTTLVYKFEVKKTGGLGIGTFLLTAVIIYTLLNPLAYLINPLFSIKYFEYLGELTVKQVFPGILAAALFIFGFSFVFIFLPKEPAPSTDKLVPLDGSLVKKFVVVASVFFFAGLVLFFWRNKIYFGSFFGSFNSIYSGADARPQTGITSNYSSFLEWSLIIYSLVIFWQVGAGKYKKILAIVPIFIGTIFAILEGNRVLIGTAVLVWTGWYFLRSKITLKLLIFAFLVLTAMTLLANARYERGEAPVVSRAALVFNPIYFRPFWAGDPTGPNVVLTFEAQRSANIRNISLGIDYLKSIESMVPSFIWPNRPKSPTDSFSERFGGQSKNGKYIPGTGFAYSMVAESMTNFWYFGPLLLGAFWSLIVIKIIRWYSSENEGINRAILALGMYFIVWFIPRGNLFIYLNPITLIGILISWYTLHKISPGVVSWPFVKSDVSTRIDEFDRD